MTDAGYAEDLSHSNLRIGLSAITCALALVAHLNPGGILDDRSAVLGCLALYCVGQCLLIAFAYLVERDYIIFTSPKKPRDAGSSSQAS